MEEEMLSGRVVVVNRAGELSNGMRNFLVEGVQKEDLCDPSGAAQARVPRNCWLLPEESGGWP